MSAIPVTMELVLDSSQAIGELAGISTAIQEQMDSVPPIEVPVKIDNQFTTQMGELTANQPTIEIPVVINTSAIEAEIADLRYRLASNPMVIPVQLVPVPGEGGFMPGAAMGAGAAAAMGAGEAAAMGAGAAAAATSVVAPELAPEVYELVGDTYELAGPAEAAGEMGEGVLGEGTAAELSEADFGRAPMSRKGRLYAQQMARRTPWYKYAGLGRHVFLGGYFAFRTLRALIGRANKEDVDAQPDLAKELEEARKDVEDSYGGIKRWLPGGEHEYQQQMRYINQGQQELDEENERYRRQQGEIHENESLRGRLDNMNVELSASGRGGLNAARATIGEELNKTLQEADKAAEQFKGDDIGARHGRELVQKMRDTANLIANAQMKQLDDQEEAMRREIYGRGDVAYYQSIGEGKKARETEFENSLDQQYEELKKRDPQLADQFKRDVEPELRAEFNAKERMRSASYSSEGRYINASATARVHEYQAEMSHDPMAEARARNEEIDANVKRLQDAANIEIDLEKKKQLEIRATAAAREAGAEKAKNIADAQRELDDRAANARETRERSHGMGYSAQKDEIEQRFKDGSISAAQRDAELDALSQDRQRQLRGLGERTREFQWQAKGRPRMAEESHIESDIQEQLRQHADDPEMQAALDREGAAQLRAFAHPQQHAQWYSSAADYTKSLQVNYLNQDHEANAKALKAAEKLNEAADKLSKAVEHGGIHVVRNGH